VARRVALRNGSQLFDKSERDGANRAQSLRVKRSEVPPREAHEGVVSSPKGNRRRAATVASQE